MPDMDGPARPQAPRQYNRYDVMKYKANSPVYNGFAAATNTAFRSACTPFTLAMDGMDSIVEGKGYLDFTKDLWERW